MDQNNDKEIVEKVIRLPRALFESLSRHAFRRNIALSNLINNELYEVNIKLNNDDKNDVGPIPHTGEGGQRSQIPG